jgi:hypothetical protein
MLLVQAEQYGRNIILAHYDALLVQLFGSDLSGLPPERIKALIKEGYLNESETTGLGVGSSQTGEPLNPILFVRRLGSVYVDANPKEKEKMRRWDLTRWSKEINKKAFPKKSTPTPTLPLLQRPMPDDLSLMPGEASIPSSFSDAEKAGLVSAFKVAGGYIRGLGANYADEFSADMYEEWNGESVLQIPNPERRSEKLKVIREEVGTAMLTKDTAQEVARRIRQRVGDLARDFERIAETEIQAVHNEGQIYAGVELDGEQARVARIPESGACDACMRLFIDPLTNNPRVFKVSDLAMNGTNVGVPKRSWKATAYPIHPHCRCDTIPLRPDQTVSRTGRIVVKK